jgi:hypothetical protein
MHVRAGSLRFVPQLAEAVLASPALPDPLGTLVYAVDPAIAGRPWRIRPGQADHLVFQEPNHDGGSALAPLAPDAAFERLASDCLLPSTQRIAALTRLHRLVREALCWRLALGDLRAAESCLLACIAKRSWRAAGDLDDYPERTSSLPGRAGCV